MKPSFRENAWGPLTFRPEEGFEFVKRHVGWEQTPLPRTGGAPERTARQFPARSLILSSTPPRLTRTSRRIGRNRTGVQAPPGLGSNGISISE
jgi:hypothetical protein